MDFFHRNKTNKESSNTLSSPWEYKDIIYHDDHIQYPGSMTIKNTTIVFTAYDSNNVIESNNDYIQRIKKENPIKYNSNFFTISLFAIRKIKLKVGTRFIIKTKDNRRLDFEANSKDLFQHLSSLVNGYDFQWLLSFTYIFYKQFNHSYKINGWNLYDLRAETKRQGLDMSAFRISQINKDYKTCETYPSSFIIPIELEDKRVYKMAELRTLRRLPVMTYFHKETKWSLWRSSQRKRKIKPSKSERKYFNWINKFGKGVKIYDARPYFNALVNSFKGNSIEDMHHYDNCSITFCDIENIHLVRKAHQEQLKTIINKLSIGSNKLWYEYIAQILKSSCEIVSDMKKNITVLVHCSDGWDRTTQLCATTQIIIDKYYRTIEGFSVLIQKDWISYGHQFAKRNGLLNGDDSNASPIFIQWLDAIIQIMIQYPNAFEFKSNLLLYLTDELYDNRFGTFLFNSDKERQEYQAKEQTVSIWSEIFEKIDLFINPDYIPSEINNIESDIWSMYLWADYFYKYDKNQLKDDVRSTYKDREKENDEINEAIVKHNTQSNFVRKRANAWLKYHKEDNDENDNKDKEKDKNRDGDRDDDGDGGRDDGDDGNNNGDDDGDDHGNCDSDGNGHCDGKNDHADNNENNRECNYNNDNDNFEEKNNNEIVLTKVLKYEIMTIPNDSVYSLVLNNENNHNTIDKKEKDINID